VITEQEVLTWWGEAPERPKRFSRVNRWIPIALIGYAGGCAEPWPSDRSRLGASFVPTRYANSARRVPLIKLPAFREPRPTKLGTHLSPITFHLSPFRVSRAQSRLLAEWLRSGLRPGRRAHIQRVFQR
jgi:hypothetical protein